MREGERQLRGLGSCGYGSQLAATIERERSRRRELEAAPRLPNPAGRWRYRARSVASSAPDRSLRAAMALRARAMHALPRSQPWDGLRAQARRRRLNEIEQPIAWITGWTAVSPTARASATGGRDESDSCCRVKSVRRAAPSARRAALRPTRRVALTGTMGRAAGVDGLDDLRVVDALQVDRGDPEVAVTELSLDDDERHALVSDSTAWAWRS
jgi:hypothetical protein